MSPTNFATEGRGITTGRTPVSAMQGATPVCSGKCHWGANSGSWQLLSSECGVGCKCQPPSGAPAVGQTTLDTPCIPA
jgi:hypothetical protein